LVRAVLIVVRHARTAANASGLLLGRHDPELDDTGRDQAARLRAGVGARPARVVSSPLRRCRDTAEVFGVPVEIDERWIEVDYGSWDGRPLTDVPRETWLQWRADNDFAPPGGESLAELSQRVVAACADLVDAAREHDVVVVSHVSPIKAAVAWALGVGVEVSWRTHLDPASITRIGIGPYGPSLRSFNERAHLGAA
jgi:broad specificity phosphatase PhoE